MYIVVRNSNVMGQHITSCVKQCYSMCACILYVHCVTLKGKYTIRVYNPQ